MEPATVLLFTSMTCPHSPNAKKIFDQIKNERVDADFHNLVVNKPEDQQMAKRFNIMSVPTFVIYGPEHDAPMGLAGVQSGETLHKYIDIALGKREEEQETKRPKKSVFKKLFKM